MARIVDGAGINVNSISKYLNELTSYYQALERRRPQALMSCGRYDLQNLYLLSTKPCQAQQS